MGGSTRKTAATRPPCSACNDCKELGYGSARNNSAGPIISPARDGACVRPAMAGTWLETAAHLADHVIPPVPVRQWVISVPKRLRGFLADRPAAVAALVTAGYAAFFFPPYEHDFRL